MASLVPDYDDSSPESSDESETENNTEMVTTRNSENRLPPPTFNEVKNSVFVNPYLEAENAEFAVLEKHVKMVPQPNKKENKVNKVCWMFKKGKCNYGKKCRFTHSNQAPESKNIVVDEPGEENELQPFDDHPLSPLSGEGSDEDAPKKKKKKRQGLPRGLIPSKRVLRLYKKHRREEGNS